MIALKKAKLKKKIQLTKDVIEFVFESEIELAFKPGQFANIKVNDGKPGMCWRAYSIASMVESKIFTLIVKILPNGRGSSFLKNLSISQEIEFIGPVGHFVLSDNYLNKKIALVATGTGIVPFYAYLDYLKEKKLESEILLIWGLRTKDDVFKTQLLEELKKEIKNMSFNICLSQEHCEEFLSGRVTSHIDLIKKFDQVYLCGNGQMIDEMKVLLEKNGKEIFFEKFN